MIHIKYKPVYRKTFKFLLKYHSLFDMTSVLYNSIDNCREIYSLIILNYDKALSVRLLEDAFLFKQPKTFEKLVLDNRININQQDFSGNTILHDILLSEKGDVTKYKYLNLLSYNINISILNNKNETILDLVKTDKMRNLILSLKM